MALQPGLEKGLPGLAVPINPFQVIETIGETRRKKAKLTGNGIHSAGAVVGEIIDPKGGKGETKAPKAPGDTGSGGKGGKGESRSPKATKAPKST